MRALVLLLLILFVPPAVAQEAAWVSLEGPGFATPPAVILDSQARALITVRGGTLSHDGETWEFFSPRTDVISVLDAERFIVTPNYLEAGSGNSPPNNYVGYAEIVHRTASGEEVVGGFRTYGGWVEDVAVGPDGDLWFGVQDYDGFNGHIGSPYEASVAFIDRDSLPSDGYEHLSLAPLSDAAELHDLRWTSSGPFAATNEGLFAPEADEWSQVAFGGQAVYVVAEAANGTLFASVDEGEVFRSTDGGAVWEQASSLPGRAVDLLAVNDGLLAAVEGHGIYRSTDDGTSWTPTDLAASASDLAGSPSGPYYAVAEGATLYRSGDGMAWTPHTYVNSTVRNLVTTPEGLIAQAGGRLYRFEAGTWQQISSLAGIEFAVSPTTGAYYIARVYDQQEEEPGDYLSRVYRSTDAGASWTPIHNFVGAPTGLAVTTEGTVLLGVFANTTGSHIKRLPEGETAWSTPYTVGSSYVRVQQGPSGSIYAVSEFGYEVSTDDGQTWGGGGGPPFPAGDFQAILESSGGALVLSSCDGVFRSDDGGTTWTASDLDLPTRPLAQNGAGDLFAGVSRCYINHPQVGGVYRSADGGLTWQPYGLDEWSVYDFALDAEGVLFAGTNRGVFQTQETTVDAEPAGTPSAFVVGPAYPNPFAGSTSVTVSLGQTAPVDVKVYDVLGRTVAELQSGPLAAGTHRIAWDAVGFASGVYFVRITSPSDTRTVPVTIAR